MSNTFKCPRCGGQYWGTVNAHKDIDYVECHNNTLGEGMSITMEEFAAGKRAGKACNWRGSRSECGLADPYPYYEPNPLVVMALIGLFVSALILFLFGW